MRMVGVAVIPQTFSPQSLLPSISPSLNTVSTIKISPLLQQHRLRSSSSSTLRIRCDNSSSPGGPGPVGENGSREVLDAFFLGKAVADALTERIESTVGEFLSTMGRLQAEQQKQVQEFQEEVFERAKKAKEMAAREARGEQGFVPTSTSLNPSTATASSSNSYTVTNTVSDPSSVANVNGLVTIEGDESTDNDSLPGVSVDE